MFHLFKHVVTYLVLITIAIAPAHVTFALSVNESAAQAAEYLERIITPDGSFVYRMDPKTGESFGGYNILRHAGSLFSLLEWYEENQDDELRAQIERGLDYVVERSFVCPDLKEALCVVEDGRIKLGGNGLAIVAFAKYELVTGDDSYRATAEGLADWVVATQVNGVFEKHIISATDGRLEPFQSEYYPGEAMLGLLLLYQVNGDETLKRAAQDGISAIIKDRKTQSLSEMPNDHWLLYALNEMDRVDPQLVWQHAAQRHAWAILFDIKKQFASVRSAPLATRLEGLGAACEIEKRAGINWSQSLYRSVLTHGHALLQELQIIDVAVENDEASPRALGGVLGSKRDRELRNDYTQHSLSAWLVEC